jgi:hypothetical protein
MFSEEETSETPKVPESMIVLSSNVLLCELERDIAVDESIIVLFARIILSEPKREIG